MGNEIVNKVAQSVLITFDLEDLCVQGVRTQIDLSQWLEQGFTLPYTLDDINELKFSENTTMSSKKDSFVYGFVSSVRQKIDAPKRRKKVKKQ